MGRYQSPLHAIADWAAALWFRFSRQPLIMPRHCDTCGRTATSVPAYQPVTPKPIACLRRRPLRRCTGQLKTGAAR